MTNASSSPIVDFGGDASLLPHSHFSTPSYSKSDEDGGSCGEIELDTLLDSSSSCHLHVVARSSIQGGKSGNSLFQPTFVNESVVFTANASNSSSAEDVNERKNGEVLKTFSINGIKRRFHNCMGGDTKAARQPTPLGLNRFVLAVIYTLYVFATSCVYFGWPGFLSMFYREKAYIWLCGGKTDNLPGQRFVCEDQDTAIQTLFQIAMPSHFITSAIAGSLMDTVGPKITACIGQGINTLAWLLLSQASESFQSYIPAFIFIGAGADMGFLPTLTIANLFPGSEGLIIAVMGSANSASFAIPTIMDSLQRSSGLPFSTIALLYVGLGTGLCFIVALLLLPHHSFTTQYHLTGVANSGDRDNNVDAHEAEMQISTFPNNKETNVIVSRSISIVSSALTHRKDDHEETEIDNDATTQKGMVVYKNPITFKQQLFSWEYMLILTFFALTSLIFNFWIVSAESLLGSEVHSFFGNINPFSFTFCILYGKLVDWKGAITVLFVNTLVGVVCYVSSLINVVASKYFSTVMMCIYVSFFTSQMYCYIEKTFDSLHFGKLIGIASLVGGCFSLIGQPLYDPLTKKVFNRNFLYVGILMLVLLVVNIFITCCLFLLYRRNPTKFVPDVVDHKHMNEENTIPIEPDNISIRERNEADTQ